VLKQHRRGQEKAWVTAMTKKRPHLRKRKRRKSQLCLLKVQRPRQKPPPRRRKRSTLRAQQMLRWRNRHQESTPKSRLQKKRKRRRKRKKRLLKRILREHLQEFKRLWCDTLVDQAADFSWHVLMKLSGYHTLNKDNK